MEGKVENQYSQFIDYLVKKYFKKNQTMVDYTGKLQDEQLRFLINFNLSPETTISTEGLSEFILYQAYSEDDEHLYIGVTTLQDGESFFFESRHKINGRDVGDNHINLYYTDEFNGKKLTCVAYYISTIEGAINIFDSSVAKQYGFDYLTKVKQFGDALFVGGYVIEDDKLKEIHKYLISEDPTKPPIVIDVEKTVDLIMKVNSSYYANNIKLEDIYKYKDFDEDKVEIPKTKEEELDMITKSIEEGNIEEDLKGIPVWMHGPVGKDLFAIFLDAFGHEDAGMYFLDLRNLRVARKLEPTQQLGSLHKDFCVYFDLLTNKFMYCEYVDNEHNPPVEMIDRNDYDLYMSIEGTGIFYGVKMHEEEQYFDLHLFEYDDGKINVTKFTTTMIPNKMRMSVDSSRLTLFYLMEDGAGGYIHTTTYMILDSRLYSYTSVSIESNASEIDRKMELMKQQMGEVNYDELEKTSLYYLNNFAHITKEKYMFDGENGPEEYCEINGYLLVNITDGYAVEPETLSLSMSTAGKFVFIKKPNGRTYTAKILPIDDPTFKGISEDIMTSGDKQTNEILKED